MNTKYLLIAIVAIVIIAVGIFAFSGSGGPSLSENSTIVDANALTEKGNLSIISRTQDEDKGFFSTDKSDVNSIFVNSSGILKLTNSIINKTGDTATSGDDADFYGVNSAILVKDKSQATIENCEINTNSKGSNGIFVTNTDTGQGQGGAPGAGGAAPGGDGGNVPEKPPEQLQKDEQATNDTVATIKNVKITTHQDKSRGLDSTFGGIIKAENILINTDGNSCAGLATDRGEGNVTVKDSTINTGVSKESGRGSPLMYSTGNITLQNSKGTSYVSQIACIEGKNSISIDNSQLVGFGEGNRKDGNKYVDLAGIFIYQSMSGDADVGTSTFDCKNSELTIDSSSSVYKEAPMFHVTNTKANINLDSSTFNGAINSTGNTTVNIESGSTWSLTGDSNVTSLNNQGKIELNGHKLLVNGEKYKG